MNYSEKAIQNKIIKDLKAKGCWVIKTQGGVAGTPIGTPDIIACGTSGNFICIEVKKIGGKISPQQLIQLKKLAKIGAVVYVTNDVDYAKGLDDIDNYSYVYDEDISFKTPKTYSFTANSIYEVVYD